MCLYLQTHISRKRYICKDLTNLSSITFGSQRVGAESEGPFHISSSVESHGVPWHGVSFPQQREVAAFSLRNSCILHKHIKVSWNSCILCEVYPPYLKAKFHPSTVLRRKIYRAYVRWQADDSLTSQCIDKEGRRELKIKNAVFLCVWPHAEL